MYFHRALERSLGTVFDRAAYTLVALFGLQVLSGFRISSPYPKPVFLFLTYMYIRQGFHPSRHMRNMMNRQKAWGMNLHSFSMAGAAAADCVISRAGILTPYVSHSAVDHSWDSVIGQL